jgi:hypothetical protein
MKKTQLNLDKALSKALPEMVKDKKALDKIVEIIAESIYSNDFDAKSNVVECLTGKGDFDEFSINIHEFLGVFWVSAPEFDDDGYFTNKDDAIAFAEDRYDAFISNFSDDDND